MIREFSNTYYHGYITNTFFGMCGITELSWKTVQRLLTEYYGEETTIGKEVDWNFLELPKRQNLPNGEEWWKYRLSLHEWNSDETVSSGRQPKCKIDKIDGVYSYTLL